MLRLSLYFAEPGSNIYSVLSENLTAVIYKEEFISSFRVKISCNIDIEQYTKFENLVYKKFNLLFLSKVDENTRGNVCENCFAKHVEYNVLYTSATELSLEIICDRIYDCSTISSFAQHNHYL